MKNELDGNGRQWCCKCAYRSLIGMVRGQGLCPYHWAARTWGKPWADRCYPNHPEAKGTT